MYPQIGLYVAKSSTGFKKLDLPKVENVCQFGVSSRSKDNVFVCVIE
jgi:hypothetical protein